MTRRQRRNLARAAADLAMAIRSGDACGVDATQRRLARIEREQRAARRAESGPACREGN